MSRGALLLVSLLVSLVFAGCVASQDDPEAPLEPAITDEPTAPRTTGVFHRGGNLTTPEPSPGNDSTNGTVEQLIPIGAGRYTGFSTFEPTIGVTSSGAIFVTNYGGTGRGTHIIRSSDQGATWEDVGPFLLPISGIGQVPNSNDPFLHVDPWTDRIIKFDMHALTAQTLEYSDDDGETWSIAHAAFGAPPALQDHQSLATAPPRDTSTRGYENVLMYCVNRGPNAAGAWCSSSFDGGLTWTPLVPGFPLGTGQCSGVHGHPVGDNEGRFYRGNPSCRGAAVYRSDDSGLTWTQHEVDQERGTFNHEVAVAVDEADNVYVFWIGQDGIPYFSASKDHGKTWTRSIRAAPPGVTATDFPTIAAGGPGQVAFAYIGTTHEQGYKAYDSDPDGVTWNGYIGMIHDAFADEPTIATVTANDPEDPLHIGPCGGQRCGGFGDFIDMAIDPEGRPWVAFADQCDASCVGSGENAGGDKMFIGTLESGRSLRGTAALGPLPPLPAEDDAGTG